MAGKWVLVNFESGDDSSEIVESNDHPFKTLDAAYKKLTESVPTGARAVRLDGDFVYNTSLKEFKDVSIISLKDAKILFENDEIELSNFRCEVPILIKLLPTSENNAVFKTQRGVVFTSKSGITVEEKVPLNYAKYSEKILFDNSGDLVISAKSKVNVDRHLIFVNNSNVVECMMPNVISRGGNIFNSTDNSKMTYVFGNEDDSIVEINPSYDYGWFSKAKCQYNFKLFNVKSGLYVKDLKLKIILNGKSSPDENYIVFFGESELPVDNSKNIALAKKLNGNNIRVPVDFLAFFENVNFELVRESENFLVSFNKNEKILNINSDLAVQDVDDSKNKSIDQNLYYTDNFAERLMVDASEKQIDIYINQTVKFPNGKLFIKKMDSTTNLVRIFGKIKDYPNGIVQLNNTTNGVSFFYYKDEIYVENLIKK